jgi:excisionase family DNA binding protein
MMKTTTTPEFINVPAFASAVADYLKDTLNQPAIGRRILTLEEAAEYCGLGLDSFKKKVVRDRIPRVRLDKRWRFDKPDLDRWIDSHKDQIAKEAAA